MNKDNSNISLQRKEKNLLSKSQFDFYLLNYYDLHILKRNDIRKYILTRTNNDKYKVQYNKPAFLILSLCVSIKVKSFLVIPLFYLSTKILYYSCNSFMSLNNCDQCEWCMQSDRYMKNIIKYKIYKLLVEENKSIICT